MLHPSVEENEKYVESLTTNPEVTKFLNSLDFQNEDTSKHSTNFLLNWFHGFFNRNLMGKSRQPEEIYGNILDIDRLKEFVVEHDLIQKFPEVAQRMAIGVARKDKRGSVLKVHPNLFKMASLDLDEENENILSDPSFHNKLSESLRF